MLSRRFFPLFALVGLTVSTMPVAAQTQPKPTPTSYYADKLTPVDSGNGILVGEPVSDGVDRTTADFGAACSYWLQVVVGGDGRIGKTPPIYQINRVRFQLHKRNLRIIGADVAPYAKALGITHVALSTISGGPRECRLTYRVRTIAGAPLGKPIVLSGNYAHVLAGLSGAARSMVSTLHGDGKNVPPGVAATSADMVDLGQNLDDYDAPTPPDQIEKWKEIAPRTSIAGMFLVGNGVVEQGIVGDLINHANGNGMVLSLLRYYVSQDTDAIDAALALASSRYPDNYSLLAGMEASQFGMRQTGAARATAERSVEAAPFNANAWSALSSLLVEEAKSATLDSSNENSTPPLYADAEEAGNRSVRLNPLDSLGWFDLSRAAGYAGDGPVASQAITKSVALNPSYAEIYRWGMTLYGSLFPDPAKKLDLAEHALKNPQVAGYLSGDILEAFWQSGDSPDVRQGVLLPAISNLLSTQTDVPQALTSALTAVRAKPGDAALWHDLGHAAYVDAGGIRRGRFWKDMSADDSRRLPALYSIAVAAQRTAVAIKPDDADSWVSLSHTAAFASHGDEACGAIAKALTIAPDNVEAYQWALQIYQPKWFDRRSDLIALVKTLQSKPTVYQALIVDIADALNQSVSRASDSDSQSDELATEKDLLKQANSDVDALLAHPDKITDHLEMGNYLQEQNKLEDATNQFELAVAQSPNDDETRYTLANAYYARQMWDKAIDAYQEVLKLNPKYTDALFYCGVLINNERHDPAGCEAMMRRLIALEPSRARDYHWLGVALRTQGDVYGARRAWQKAVDLDPNGYDEGNQARDLLAQTQPTAPQASATADSGTAPLINAVLEKKVDVVTSLLSHKTNVDVRDSDGRTPLYLAAETDQADIVVALIAKGADVNVKANDKKPLLAHIAETGSVETLRYLLDHGADVDATDSYSSTALIYAVIHSKPNMVTLLIQHHADVNHKNSHSETALSLAVRDHHNQIIPILQAAGATQ